MTTPSTANDSGHVRRLIATLIVATAAAAVTAGVALTHPHVEAVVQVAEAGPAPAGAVATTATPVVTRREQWRDPWKRPAPFSEPVPSSMQAPLHVGTTRSDPSLPAAGDALGGAAGASAEATPTF